MKQLQQTINSREVAKMVGREHAKVIRDTRGLIEHLTEAKIGLSEYFVESTYKDASGRILPCFNFTKKGCELYSTRMTGAKGTQFAVAYIERFNQMEEHIKTGNASIDSETKRMNAEARLKNAKVREAKLLAELANDATSEVNKVLLQDRAVEILSGKKLLKKPTFKQKMLDCKTIAERLGILTKNGELHITAVSQLIQCHIAVNEKESEIVPFFNGHKSGSMINYAESVLTKVQIWLEDHNYPSKIQGVNKKYHVQYE